MSSSTDGRIDMNVIKKFDFGTCFDGSVKGQEARREFSEQDIERARQEGHAEGRAQALAEAREAAEVQSSKALAAGADALRQLGDSLSEMRQESEANAIRLARDILRKLLPHSLERRGFEEIESLVAACLHEMAEEPRLVVRVHETLVETLGERIDRLGAENGFSGRIVLFPDRTLAPSDCRVEWADGGVERRPEALWAGIEEQIDRFLATQSPEDET